MKNKFKTDGKILVNFTDHEVVDKLTGTVIPKLEDDDPMKKLIRADMSSKTINEVNGIPIKIVTPTGVTGLPEPDDKHIYIVSSLVIGALKEMGIKRNDVVSPGPIKRNNKTGKIEGCLGLRGYEIEEKKH